MMKQVLDEYLRNEFQLRKARGLGMRTRRTREWKQQSLQYNGTIRMETQYKQVNNNNMDRNNDIA